MVAAQNKTAESKIQDQILRHGSLSFSDFMSVALYDDEFGFYQGRGNAGRRGDFITSPEIGPLFGHLIGRYVDSQWERLGKPDPFFVFDIGAGPGTLAKSLLASQPKSMSALRIVLVEASNAQREMQLEKLTIEPPTSVFGAVTNYGESRNVVSGQGPIICSIDHLPAIRIDGVVVCNELFDNLPFDIAYFDGHTWVEARVANKTNDSNFHWVEEWQTDTHAFCTGAALDESNQAWLKLNVPDPAEGTLVPWLKSASSCLQKLLEVIEKGAVLVLDYGGDTSMLAQRSPDWLRTFRSHQPGTSPLADIGKQDITADVPFDQLARVVAPTRTISQTDFLNELGIDELVDEGKNIWNERAHIGDLEAVKARSRIGEAEALRAENGLGAFVVAEWVS